ncbi:MAG: hypothetical protein AB7I50_08425 [Vicinamibacterales bacterium]
MSSVTVAPTIDRAVLGIMVDFTKAVPYYLDSGQRSKPTLRVVEERLAKTPCHASRPFKSVVFPEKRAPELLRAKWLTHTPLAGRWTGVH